MRLENKVAIVSGGGTGIGAATARLFATQGAKVVVTGRRAEPLEAVAAEIDGRAVAGDTSDDDHVRSAVAAARDAFGGLDIVVANAGLAFGGAAADVEDERWQQTLDVNLTGAFRLARAAIPSLVEWGGGSIVLVSSVSALVSGTDGAAYVTSKAALLGLARSIAVDYGPSGIRANALSPVAMTDMTHLYTSEV
jgi:NAD(P)-dependent dehydrogenase (short-subunit alcohol dehydrogenase family)